MVLAATVTAPQVIAESVDRRLANANASAGLSRFVNYPSGADRDKFEPNPKFWAKEVDFSCASPWNSAGGALRAGTLISKRHFVCVKHFPFWKGVRILFVDNNGNVCPCSVEAVKALDGVDIMVGLLNAEVTPNINPAKILPGDYEKHIGNGKGLPVATFNLREELVVTEMTPIPTNRLMVIGHKLTSIPHHIRSELVKDGKRAEYRKLLIRGDSGNPAFFIVGNEPILLYCDCSNNSSSGPPLHLYRREIQKAMDDLCPGYKLEAFDFSKVNLPVFEKGN